MKSENTSLIPIVSSRFNIPSFTSGRAHKISGNFIIFVIWLSYFVFTLSAYPVKDLINYKFRAVCIHLPWFSSHIFYFYYSDTSLRIFVLKIIYFYLVFGEVRQTFILTLLMNSSSFFFLISSR